MATIEPSPASGSNRPSRPRTRRPRRGGHRNAGPAPADSNTNSNLNSNVTPNAAAQASNGPVALGQTRLVPLPGTDSSNPSNSRNANANNRGSQGRRGDGRRGGSGRGGRRGGPRGQTMTNGRIFGGQLTSNSHSGPTSDAASLAGDAPSFVPGQNVAARPGPSQAPRARRMSKSQAPDLATRTHEDITNGQYDMDVQNLLVGSTFVVCQKVVEERGIYAPTESGRKRRIAATETMEMSWLQLAQRRYPNIVHLLV
ncbi:hypothetical protein DID88_005098 [Monilinia fructigena]|uniref:Uncharacterized protein n=1 Tax=Monilinia fructigena TaxID=38457 RepID=A0A395IT19_9HELO|nr:hypothetical protein DID88_005098 [Monilinia fructigena]